MAAVIGHVNVDLLARAPGSEPRLIGTVQVPVEYTPTLPPKPTVQTHPEDQRPRVTRITAEAPPTRTTTRNLVRQATHDLDEGTY
jgi:hypothetical protein